MCLHTAKKKINELDEEELNEELKSAIRLFRNITWRMEYNKRMKYFKENYPNATESEIRNQYSKEAHHIANILNTLGENYIVLLEDYIKLKRKHGYSKEEIDAVKQKMLNTPKFDEEKFRKLNGLYSPVKNQAYSVLYEGKTEDGKEFTGRKFYNTEQEALDEMDELMENKDINIISVKGPDDKIIQLYTRGY